MLAAAVIAGLLVGLSRPWLARLAPATPGPRSSHGSAVPQGGGIGTMAAFALVCVAGTLLLGLNLSRILPLLVALAAITALGLVDDIRPLGWRTKLLLQAGCCTIAVAGLPSLAGQTGSAALFWLERVAMTLVLVVNVNFVNFVDGIDEITVAHAGPGLAAAALSCLVAPIAPEASLAAAAGLGALLGFWFWNRHPARIFLGDAGSLPVGLLMAWLALAMAASGFWAAGLLITLYPLVEAGLTLIRRVRAGARLTQPHRDHAYQRAVDTGIPARRVAATVAVVATAVAMLALVDLVTDNHLVNVAAVAIGLAWIVFPIIGWLRRAGGTAPGGRSA